MRIPLFTFFVFTLSSCSNPTPKVLHNFTGLMFQMPYHVMVVGANHLKIRELIQDEIDACEALIHTKYNHWNLGSTLSLINQNKGPFTIDNEMYELLCIAKEIHQLSDRAYDPTLRPLIQLYKSSLEEGRVLSRIELGKIHFGFEKLSFTKESLIKHDSELELDLDSLIKGFFVDLLANKLKSLGFTDFFIDFSGDIKALGKHIENRPWIVGIEGTDAIIELSGFSIATSGSTKQKWIHQDGKVYSHIIGIKDLKPIVVKEGAIASVSVKARSCTLADALATASLAISDRKNLDLFIDKVRSRYEDVDFWITEYQRGEM